MQRRVDNYASHMCGCVIVVSCEGACVHVCTASLDNDMSRHVCVHTSSSQGSWLWNVREGNKWHHRLLVCVHVRQHACSSVESTMMRRVCAHVLLSSPRASACVASSHVLLWCMGACAACRLVCVNDDMSRACPVCACMRE